MFDSKICAHIFKIIEYVKIPLVKHLLFTNKCRTFAAYITTKSKHSYIMNKKIYALAAFMLLASLGLSSCSSDNDPVEEPIIETPSIYTDGLAALEWKDICVVNKSYTCINTWANGELYLDFPTRAEITCFTSPTIKPANPVGSYSITSLSIKYYRPKKSAVQLIGYDKDGSSTGIMGTINIKKKGDTYRSDVELYLLKDKSEGVIRNYQFSYVGDCHEVTMLTY